MNLNVVLDSDVILDLLSLSQNDVKHCFTRLQKSPIHFWLPCCLCSVLETQIFPAHHQPLKTLLDNNVQLLSSWAAHWQAIPQGHSNKTQALMSLDAAVLPGNTIIWTKNPNFTSANPKIECGDHEFVYGILAEYEYADDNKLPFYDLVSQQVALRPLLEKQFINVLQHGQYILGAEVQTLESQLAAYVGAKHCITMANGTDALLCALLAVGVKAGDEVITSPFSFIAGVEVIALLGATPVFVDIDPQTYNLNPALLEAAITPKTKAIMPVSLYGQCADFDAINAIATHHQLPVIEDAAQSFGATYHGRSAGHLATIGCTSFFPSKPLGAFGDAGACFTDDDSIAETLRQLRTHGQDKRYHHCIVGINSRLDTLQAGILLAKLTVFPQELEKRAHFGENYTKLLQNLVKTPFIADHNTSVYAQYTIEVDNRDHIQQQLQERGIPTAIHYPSPLHLQPAYTYLKQGVGSFPVAEAAANRVLSLPMHPYLTEEIQSQIVDTLKKFCLKPVRYKRYNPCFIV